MSARAVSVIAVGLGCRRAASAQAIAALVRSVVETAGLPLAAATLFAPVEKAGEPALRDAAACLGLPLVALERERLAGIVTPTQSPRVNSLFGVGSVAEGAALAGAGQGAALVVPRVVRDGATCAVAVGGGLAP